MATSLGREVDWAGSSLHEARSRDKMITVCSFIPKKYVFYLIMLFLLLIRLNGNTLNSRIGIAGILTGITSAACV
jgi:hypothetical protein